MEFPSISVFPPWFLIPKFAVTPANSARVIVGYKKPGACTLTVAIFYVCTTRVKTFAPLVNWFFASQNSIEFEESGKSAKGDSTQKKPAASLSSRRV